VALRRPVSRPLPFRRPYAVFTKINRGRGTRCRAPPPPSGSLGPRKVRPCFRSRGVGWEGPKHSACAADPATRTGIAAHAPRKQGGRRPCCLLAWLPMLTSRRLLLLSRCLAGRDPKTGRRPLPSPPRRGFQAGPLRLLANYRPAGKRSTILLKEPQAPDDWPLPLGRNQRHVVTTERACQVALPYHSVNIENAQVRGSLQIGPLQRHKAGPIQNVRNTDAC
jgi:hypothetical protein